MTEKTTACNASANPAEGTAATDEILSSKGGRLPLKDLYIARKRELVDKYFDASIRLRLAQQMARRD